MSDSTNNQSASTETAKSGLLLVAHGSRVHSSNEEIMQLGTALARRLHNQSGSDPRADVVEHAFLELTEPSIPQGIDKCAARGVTELLVLPYFLAAGRHVREDIPDAVEQGRLRHPDMAITVLSHVGQSDAMLDLIVAMTNDSRLSN